MKTNVPRNLRLRFLNNFANSRTGHFGEDNYIFKFLDEEIIIDDKTQNKKLVNVLENEDGIESKYVIECFERQANFFWGKEIIVKNATKRQLKTEVTYQTRDVTKEKDRK